jgi:hypothetical protein
MTRGSKHLDEKGSTDMREELINEKSIKTISQQVEEVKQ